LESISHHLDYDISSTEVPTLDGEPLVQDPDALLWDDAERKWIVGLETILRRIQKEEKMQGDMNAVF
jgi:hypothetical protein